MASKKTYEDPDFGGLVHRIGNLWVSNIVIPHFGHEWNVVLNILFDQSQGIEDEQRRAHQLLQENFAVTMTTAENEISKYAVLNGVEKSRIADAVRPIAINFPAVQHRPTFGILYDVSWEPEHGAAVRFVDGEFAEVGLQDIVL